MSKRITHGRPGTLYIGIDCAVGEPRPDFYIGHVVSSLIDGPVGSPRTKLFGAWTWEFEGVTEEQWDENKEKLISKCEELYEDRRIRGAKHYWVTAIERELMKTLENQGVPSDFIDMETLMETLGEDKEMLSRFERDFEFASSVVRGIVMES